MLPSVYVSAARRQRLICQILLITICLLRNLMRERILLMW